MKKIFILSLLLVLLISCRNNDVIIESEEIQNSIELKTNNPSFISQIQVDYEGEIVKINNEEIISYGMLIGKNENLTEDVNEGNQTREYANGDKIFSGSFYDLKGDKKYYLRFYVKTKSKIYYGNTVSFISKKHNSPNEQRIYLSTQQQVNDFGKNNYTYVYELNIGGSVEDLSPLTSLIKIGGNLNIEYTSKLTSLHGLENLQLIGTDQFPNGQLQIYKNTKLETLSGLDKLMFTGKLYVGYNPLVKNLQGLGNLEQAWHRTYLTVPSFDGLPLNFRTGEFTSIGFEGADLGNRTINCEAYDFALKDAPNITTLKGFIVGNYQNTTSFTLENCKKLKTLDGIVFPSKYDDILISNCENFESLKGFDNLTIANLFTLKDLPKLKNLEGLSSLSQIERLYLSNVGINTFNGLNNVKTIDHLSVSSCNNLSNFVGLSSLTKIGDEISYFEVANCTNLEDFVGLEKVQHFTRFNIYSLPKLKNFDGIKEAKMPYITISNCNLINSLQGLERVFGVGNIAIYENNNLQNFCAIKNVVRNLNSNSYFIKENMNNPTQQELINSCP